MGVYDLLKKAITVERSSLLLILLLAVGCQQSQAAPQDEAERRDWVNERLGGLPISEHLDAIKDGTGVLYIPSYLPQGVTLIAVMNGSQQPLWLHFEGPSATLRIGQYAGQAVSPPAVTPETVTRDGLRLYRLRLATSGGIHFMFQKDETWFEIEFDAIARGSEFETTELVKVADSLAVWHDPTTGS